VAAPMPRVPPVTSAIRFLSCFVISFRHPQYCITGCLLVPVVPIAWRRIAAAAVRRRRED
jgi:hypothetical protein